MRVRDIVKHLIMRFSRVILLREGIGIVFDASIGLKMSEGSMTVVGVITGFNVVVKNIIGRKVMAQRVW